MSTIEAYSARRKKAMSSLSLKAENVLEVYARTVRFRLDEDKQKSGRVRGSTGCSAEDLSVSMYPTKRDMHACMHHTHIIR